MELFNEIKSKYHTIIYDIIHTMRSNENILSGKDIKAIIASHEMNFPDNSAFPRSVFNISPAQKEDDPQDTKNKKDINKIDKDYNFYILKKLKDKDSKEKRTKSLPSKKSKEEMTPKEKSKEEYKEVDFYKYSHKLTEAFYMNPLEIEKIWLKSILADPKIKLFLTDETIVKLTKSLEETKDIISDSVEIRNNSTNDTLISDKLKRIKDIYLKAIKNGQGVQYSYVMRNGNTIKDARSIPYKVEYSVKDDIFYLISYSLDQYRPIKSLLKNFSEIQVFDLTKDEKKILSDIQARIDNKKEPEPVVLEIIDEKNVVERAFLDFSNFERKASFDNNIHELSVFYYSFEEEVIISKILALGKYVMVKSPEKIRGKVIERIKQSFEIYNKNSYQTADNF